MGSTCKLAHVSEVTEKWDLTRRASSSLCHASAGDESRSPGNVDGRKQVDGEVPEL